MGHSGRDEGAAATMATRTDQAVQLARRQFGAHEATLRIYARLVRTVFQISAA